METRTIKLTIPEIDHIFNLIKDNEEEGCYYGNREQYWNRSSRIKEKLDGITISMETLGKRSK